jgi:hypothetical protein
MEEEIFRGFFVRILESKYSFIKGVIFPSCALYLLEKQSPWKRDFSLINYNIKLSETMHFQSK